MSKKSKKQRKKERAAQLATQPVVQQKPVEPKTHYMKCFEVSFTLIDSNNKILASGQYFHQPKGIFQGIMDSFAYAHRFVENERQKTNRIWAIDRVTVYEWALAIPGPRGVINTKKFSDPVYSWAHQDKIKVMTTSLTKKQLKRVRIATIQLDRWRPIRVKVLIEEITQDVDNALGILLGS